MDNSFETWQARWAVHHEVLTPNIPLRNERPNHSKLLTTNAHLLIVCLVENNWFWRKAANEAPFWMSTPLSTRYMIITWVSCEYPRELPLDGWVSSSSRVAHGWGHGGGCFGGMLTGEIEKTKCSYQHDMKRIEEWADTTSSWALQFPRYFNESHDDAHTIWLVFHDLECYSTIYFVFMPSTTYFKEHVLRTMWVEDHVLLCKQWHTGRCRHGYISYRVKFTGKRALKS